MAVTRSLKQNVDSVLLKAPISVTATGSSTGVDTVGYDSLMFDIICGAIGSAGNFTPTVQESDTDVDGDYTLAVAADVEWGGATALAIDPIVTNTVQRVGYKGGKRYARIHYVLNSGTSAILSIVAHHGHAHSAAIV